MLIQSPFAYGRQTPPVPYSHGAVTRAVFEHTFTSNFTSASDILEIGILPASARITNATLIGEGLGAITADVATMTGDASEEYTSAGGDRALTSDLLFDGASVDDAETDATKLTCLGIPTATTHRGLGVTLSGDVAAGDDKKITLILEYTY